jgi:hypothetical protein
MTKAQALTEQSRLEAHFTPGNIVYSAYWANHDRVLGFERTQYGFSVSVIRCDAHGNAVPDERVRSHSTYPDFKRGDRVVLSGVLTTNP